MYCPTSSSASGVSGSGVSGVGGITTILDAKNIPTINQMKNTVAFKRGNHAFKHISLSMFKHMTGLKKDATNQKTTKSIVNSVLIGYNSQKAKNILISIASEMHGIMQKKEEESLCSKAFCGH